MIPTLKRALNNAMLEWLFENSRTLVGVASTKTEASCGSGFHPKGYESHEFVAPHHPLRD